VVYVADLEFDEYNEAEMARHGVTPTDVWQVLDDAPRYFRNPAGRGATHKMIGFTDGGLLLTVPISQTAIEDRWRPATAWPSGASQSAQYHQKP